MIYSNTFRNQFVFDDLPGIADNNAIKDISNIKPMWDDGKTRIVSFYTFALNYHFHQLDLFGYHLVNLVIHLVNATLVWWLVLLLFDTPRLKREENGKEEGKEFIAFFTALIFVTHPIQTQAVTYIYQRFASLATLFYFLSICLYINGKLRPHVRIVSFLGAAISAVLGMFTKEIVFTLPFAVLLIDYCFLKTSKVLKKTKMSWQSFLPVFLLTLVIPLLYQLKFSFIFGNRIRLSNEHAIVTSGTYLLTQFKVIVTYIRLLFCPLGQNLDYDFPLAKSFFDPTVFFSFAFLVCVFVLALRLLKTRPLISFGILWFFLTLSVESSVIPIRHVIFEHRLYLPMFGFCLSLCVGLHDFLKDSKKFSIVVGLIALVFSTLTYQRNQVWQNSMTLWSDVIKKSPGQSRAYDNLASAYIEVGEFTKALPYLQKAIDLDPRNDESYNNLGLIYLETGQWDLAIERFSQAVALNPHYAIAYNNMGVIFLRKGDFKPAEEYFLLSTKLNPNFLNSQLNLAEVYYKQGKIRKSTEVYLGIIRLNPSQKESLYALAEIYLGQGETSQAAEIGGKMFKTVNHAGSLTAAGSLFAKNNLNEMASLLYKKALRLDPQNKFTYLEFGKLLGNSGQLEKAIAVWEKGAQLDPNEKEFQDLIQTAKNLQNNLQGTQKNH